VQNNCVKKCSKLWVKLTPGVNFINILIKAFKQADHKSAKNTVKLSVSFTLLGSAHIKAACKMLVKLAPGDPGIGCLPPTRNWPLVTQVLGVSHPPGTPSSDDRQFIKLLSRTGRNDRQQQSRVMWEEREEMNRTYLMYDCVCMCVFVLEFEFPA